MSTNYGSVPGQTQKKKTPWWVWGLVGCGGLVVIVVVVLVAGGAYLWTKVPKTEMGMVAKIIEMANPDVEVVNLDEERGIVTLKNKKTGEQVTVNLEDAKSGKIVFSDGKESVTIGGEEGVIKLEGEKGSTVYGQAPEDLPSWLPSYPGAQVQPGGVSTDRAGLRGGVFTFTTSDSVSQVLAFYKEQLGQQGLHPRDESQESISEDFGALTVRSDDERKSITITASRSGDKTTVGVSFEEKRAILG